METNQTIRCGSQAKATYEGGTQVRTEWPCGFWQVVDYGKIKPQGLTPEAVRFYTKWWSQGVYAKCPRCLPRQYQFDRKIRKGSCPRIVRQARK